MLVGLLGIAGGWGSAARGATLTFHPSIDNSIYSEADRSNGLGSLYVGKLPNGNVRRALLQFDLLGGGIPAGSIISAVTLVLTQTKHSNALIEATQTFELSVLLDAWGEGTSFGTGPGGDPTPGDATWHHRFYNTSTWTVPGGDFSSTASGTVVLGMDDISYTFNSQTGLVADVQRWIDTPSSNFGWILRASGDGQPGAAVSGRVFGSGETIGAEPILTVIFSPAPEPDALSLLGAASLLASGKRFRRTARRLPV